MATDDFFRARLQTMIDMRHPLAQLAARLPWPAIEAALAPKFAHEDRPPKSQTVDGLFGAEQIEFAGGVSRAGRPRRPIRLMAGLLYLKNSFNLSDEELVQRWSENVYWQHFCGMEYFEPRLPCDATQIGRFRRAIGEEGLELLLKATIETAVQSEAIKPQELERVIVDSTVQVRREVANIIVSPAHKAGDETGCSVSRSLPVHASPATASCEATGTTRQAFGPRRSL